MCPYDLFPSHVGTRPHAQTLHSSHRGSRVRAQFLRTSNVDGYVDQTNDGIGSFPCLSTVPALPFLVTGTPISVTGAITEVDFVLAIGGTIGNIRGLSCS